MQKYIMIIILIIGLCWIVYCFCKGRKNALELEERCKITIKAKINKIEKHKFLFCNYYGVTVTYQYNGINYFTKRAIFGEIPKDLKRLIIHINEDNPNECYYTTLREKCKCKQKKR